MLKSLIYSKTETTTDGKYTQWSVHPTLAVCVLGHVQHVQSARLKVHAVRVVITFFADIPIFSYTILSRISNRKHVDVANFVLLLNPS